MQMSFAGERATEKERFVSNLLGTSPVSIILMTHLFAFFPVIRGLLCLIKNPTGTFYQFNIDFFVLVFSSLLFVTVLHSYYTFSVLSASFVLLCLVVYIRITKKYDPCSEMNHALFQIDMRSVRFAAKSILNVLTAICILAVDFHVFPRELAKVEWYGTGLMGVGVGSFVFFNSFTLADRRYDRSSLLLFGIIMLIGLVKSATVSMIGYQKHVSEYGVHWNFFITLSFVQLLSNFTFAYVKFAYCLAFLVSIICQYCSVNGLSNFMRFENNRTNIVSANIEGIISLTGFVSISFFAMVLGQLSKSFLIGRPITYQLTRTGFIILAFAIMTYVADRFIEPICRSSANLAYQLWMVVYNMDTIFSGMVMGFLLDTLLPLKENSLLLFYGRCSICAAGIRGLCGCLFTVIYRNQLLFFLLANMLTGVVNLSINTLDVTDTVALIICACYLYVTCGAMLLKEIYWSRKLPSS